MTKDHRERVATLLRVLGSAASYNDKGCIWSGHSPEEQAAFRAELQEQIRALAISIGAAEMGHDLYEALMSGAAVEDASVDLSVLARSRLWVQHAP
jgi:hypothetical protein